MSREDFEDFVDIPSSENSFSSDVDSNIESITDIGDDFLTSETDSDCESDNIPLSALAAKIQSRSNSNIQQQSASKASSNWDKLCRVPNISPFLGNDNLPDFVQSLDSPIEVFSLFISDDMIEHIVFQTNLYAQQKDQLRNRPTNANEIRAFIAINLLMGIKVLPSYRDYWSTAPDLHDSFISTIMDVNRFGWLLTHIHLNDNSNIPKRDEPGFDKLYKVRPFLDMLQTNFIRSFNLSEIAAIDESMVKFKGRSSLKQYMPKKPIKRGYKIWVLADKTGYCYKFQIYTGKVRNSVEKSLAERVVKDLCHGLEGKGYKIFFDNYFSSVSLLEYLKAVNIYACGTMNPSRKGLPTFNSDRQMRRGDIDFFTNESGLYVVKWKDKRSVHVISNYHNPNNITTVKRRNKFGVVEDIPCPSILIDYNHNMNCVDKLDQLKSAYQLDRKSLKWWHRIMFHFLDVSVVNSYIIYKKLKLETKTLKDFRRAIVIALLSDTITSKKQKRKKSQPVQIKKHKPHVPSEIRTRNSAHQPQRATRRRCGLCSTKNHQIRTEWMCQTCKIPLCITKNRNCFQAYHS